MVHLGSTIACFKAERHLFQDIEVLRRVYSDFKESGEHAATAEGRKGYPESKRKK